MCSACGFPASPGHWTDAGAVELPDRLRNRFRRADVLARLLKPYGLAVRDGGRVPGFQLCTLSGRQVIVPTLEALWVEAARMIGVPIDPLDPVFLERAE